jgi:hypothetical protein
MDVGTVYTIPPQPPVAESTRWFPAGALTIGVEYRDVDPDGLVATYADDPEQLAELLRESPEGGFSDEGVSIHVASAESGHEYLRFDAFDGEPHYHYIHDGPEVVNHVVPFDAVADGDMLAWTFQRLRTRLPQMLAEAGAPQLGAAVDAAAIERALAEVESVAEAAQTRLRAVRHAAGPPLGP